MDEWSFLDEVDVIAKWPAEHKKCLFEGGKWSEKRDSLDALNKIMEDNPRLSSASMTIYGELMDELRKILDRESNIVVVTFAAKTVELLAKGLRNKFGGYVGMVFPFLIKRAKDKKKNVRDAVSLSLDAVSDTTTPERIMKDIVDWFSIPSPESKQTLLEFLYRYFIKMENIDTSFVKTMMPMIVKCASESDVNVREKACMAIGSLKRLIGDAIIPSIVSISGDNSKMEKVTQFETQAKEEWQKMMAEKGQNRDVASTNGENENQDGTAEQASNSGASQSETVDPWTLIDPEDVTNKLDKAVETQLVDKNWKERLAGCEALKKEIDAVGRIEISERLRQIIPILLKIIEKDVNINVGTCAVNCLTGIATKSRFAYSQFATKGFPICFEKMKDKKALLRDALNELVDAAACTTPLGSYSEAVANALANKNPQTRSQTALFLSRLFSKNDSKTMDFDALKALVEPISKASNDADKEVREAVIRCISAIVKCIGQNLATKLFTEVFEDNLKAEKIPKNVEELEKEYGKTASVEMTRLAKEYKIGQTTSNPETKNVQSVAKKPFAARPAPVRKDPTPVSSRPKSSVPAQRVPPKAPSTASVPIQKPFAARPAPNFNNRPSNPVKIEPKLAKPAVSRPTTSGASSRPITATSRINTSGPSIVRSTRTPIAPNVVRSTPSSVPNRAPSAGRSSVSGIKPNVVSSGSRIAAPKTSLPSSTIRSIPRPNTSSGIPKPGSLSRAGSSEVVSKIRPFSRGSRTEINNV